MPSGYLSPQCFLCATLVTRDGCGNVSGVCFVLRMQNYCKQQNLIWTTLQHCCCSRLWLRQFYRRYIDFMPHQLSSVRSDLFLLATQIAFARFACCLLCWNVANLIWSTVMCCCALWISCCTSICIGFTLLGTPRCIGIWCRPTAQLLYWHTLRKVCGNHSMRIYWQFGSCTKAKTQPTLACECSCERCAQQLHQPHCRRLAIMF